MSNENDLIFNRYAISADAWKNLLTEADQKQVKQQQLKQQFEQQLNDPKTQEAMKKQASELQQKYSKEINQALQKDGGKAGSTVESLLKKIQLDLDAQVKQKLKESVEASGESIVLNEGPLDRAISSVAGALRRGKEVMGNVPQQDAKSSAQHAIIKRFEMMQKRVESDLRELERDLATTSGTDTKVKDAVTKTIAQIGSKHGFTPRQSKFQDFRHSAGKFAQNVVTGAILAAPLVAVAGPLVAAIGLTGAGAAAATAGISAGSVSMLKDLIDGQKPNGKKAAVAAVTAAATAGLFKWAMDNWTGNQAPVTSPADNTASNTNTTPAQTSTVDQAATAVSNASPKIDMNELFKTATNSEFNPVSKLDKLRMGILDAMVKSNDAVSPKHQLDSDTIAKIFGDWSDKLNAGKGASTRAVLNALESAGGRSELVNDLLKARTKV